MTSYTLFPGRAPDFVLSDAAMRMWRSALCAGRIAACQTRVGWHVWLIGGMAR